MCRYKKEFIRSAHQPFWFKKVQQTIYAYHLGGSKIKEGFIMSKSTIIEKKNKFISKIVGEERTSTLTMTAALINWKSVVNKK